MFAVCVECSHYRGMGNLFRSLNIIQWLKSNGLEYILLINRDEKTLRFLNQYDMKYIVVDLWDYSSNWEKVIIEKYHIHTWINDRMRTDIRHAMHVHDCGVRLCSFDDTGEGSKLVDQNFCAMVFENTENLQGRKIYTGVEYLILNREILQYRYQRNNFRKLVVTLGGSDTYGVTKKILTYLKDMNLSATIIMGPCFENKMEIEEIACGGKYELLSVVPSLPEEFSKYDLAITGGGITPFEACAAGLPCIIVANELHEIQVGHFLENCGCAKYAGYHKELSYSYFQILFENMEEKIELMSKQALHRVTLDGVDNVMKEIINER